jgi:hypothetical protein
MVKLYIIAALLLVAVTSLTNEEEYKVNPDFHLNITMTQHEDMDKCTLNVITDSRVLKFPATRGRNGPF